jgi:hypothetical protein
MRLLILWMIMNIVVNSGIKRREAGATSGGVHPAATLCYYSHTDFKIQQQHVQDSPADAPLSPFPKPT